MLGVLDDVQLNVIESWQDAVDFQAWLTSGPMNHGAVAVDTETTGLSPENDVVRLVQLGDDTQGWAIPWVGWSGLFDDAMQRFNGRLLMHNAPYDFAMIKKMGTKLDRSRIRDTRVSAHILDPTYSTALKKQASKWVDPSAGAAQVALDQALHGSKAGWTWGTIPITFAPYWQYAAMDPVLTFWLDRVITPMVEETAPIALSIENSVQWVLEQMMRNGAPVDVEYAQYHRARFLKYVDDAEKWTYEHYKCKPGSNMKIVQILQEAGHEFSKLTASGAVALDKEVLEGIDHPLARTVLKRRRLQKLANTYLDFYINNADARGRIHPRINSLGARTGRMSMDNPNLQNLPRVSENNPAASVVRGCIAAEADHTLLFCDFSQIETRILAHLSEDPGLIAAFFAPEDFFVSLARTVFNDASITKKDPRRNVIKTLVYAKIYGAGLAKMASGLGIEIDEMKRVIDAFDASYPGIRMFQDRVYATAMENKAKTGDAFILCPYTKRKHVAEPNKEYALVNYMIQGMAAALFKTKLLELNAAGLGPYMIAPVHDEVISHVPNDKLDWAADVLIQIMNDNTVLRVPIAAEVSYGERWGHKLDWPPKSCEGSNN